MRKHPDPKPFRGIKEGGAFIAEGPGGPHTVSLKSGGDAHPIGIFHPNRKKKRRLVELVDLGDSYPLFADQEVIPIPSAWLP